MASTIGTATGFSDSSITTIKACSKGTGCTATCMPYTAGEPTPPAPTPPPTPSPTKSPTSPQPTPPPTAPKPTPNPTKSPTASPTPPVPTGSPITKSPTPSCVDFVPQTCSDTADNVPNCCGTANYSCKVKGRTQSTPLCNSVIVTPNAVDDQCLPIVPDCRSPSAPNCCAWKSISCKEKGSTVSVTACSGVSS